VSNDGEQVGAVVSRAGGEAMSELRLRGRESVIRRRVLVSGWWMDFESQ
jgi:hypothetical protein